MCMCVSHIYVCVCAGWLKGLEWAWDPMELELYSPKLYKVGTELPSSRRTGSIPNDGITGMIHYT